MSIASIIAQRGVDAEKKLDSVLDATEANNDKLRSVSDLEEVWEAARRDGSIDAGELAELETAAAEAGLSPELLKQLRSMGTEGPISGEALEKLGDQIAKAARSARRNYDASEGMLALRRNILVSDIQTHYTHASNVSKAEHETYMNIIGNMKA